ncbi:FG-GAP-like repeat-containing protein [bacterium]|nr:FG-GAP-like repeat-containing protein [bacterium]
MPCRAAFTDISDTALLLPAEGVTYGVGWGDFDLDGDRDCFISRHYLRPIVYENLGDGTMTYALFPGLFDLPDDHHGGLIADIDEDGDLDIYLTGGADAGSSSVPKKMYRNDGGFDFPNVAMAWGLTDSLARGRSASAMDLEGDGDVDLFVAKAPRAISPNSLFVNDGAQNFTDVAAASGLADEFGSAGGLWGDYDGDGDADLLVSGEEEATFQTRLYRNDGALQFTDVTAATLPETNQLGGACWGDYDNDGDLDLAAGYGDLALFDAVSWNADTLSFFFNTRGFDNGLDGLAFLQSGDSATYALALDGYYQPDRIFIADGGENPATVPFTIPYETFGAPSFFPGDPPAFYVWNQESLPIWELRTTAPPVAGHGFAGLITTNGTFTDVAEASLEPYTHGLRGTRIWRNDGGVFRDVTTPSGVKDSLNVHCVQWVDVDQDGNLDLYVLGKGDTNVHNEANVFYHNTGNAFFQDETAAWQLEGPADGLGDAFAFEDYDDDGDLDVMMVSGSGPKFIADREQARLYRNDGAVGNWLRVDLEGVQSTRDGYGAWVTCLGTPAGRQVRYVTGNNWRGAQEMLEPRFGLGAATVVESIIVNWPSGKTDVFTDVPAGDVTLIEGSGGTASPLSPPMPGPLRIAVRPQPSGGQVTFRFGGRRNIAGRLELFDSAGRRVHARTVPAGELTAEWDGTGADGKPLAAGVYFARWSEGKRTATTKVVRLRP